MNVHKYDFSHYLTLKTIHNLKLRWVIKLFIINAS